MDAWVSIAAADIRWKTLILIIYVEIDDGSRARAMMAVLSTMFCETFLRLQADNLLQPASPLKNTGLVAALLVRWTPEFPNQHGRERLREVVQLCRDNNIELSLGPKEIDEEVEEHLERLGKPPTHMATDWLDEHPEEDDDKIQDPEERKKIQDRRFFIECATGSWYKKPAKARKQAATSDDEWTDEDEDSPAGFEKEVSRMRMSVFLDNCLYLCSWGNTWRRARLVVANWAGRSLTSRG